jgi:hypothetical protein
VGQILPFKHEFLATDLSDYVNGTVIPIDGGLVWIIRHLVEPKSASAIEPGY